MLYPGGGYPGEYFPGQADDGQAAIVGAGGVEVGGAATVEATHAVIVLGPSGGRFIRVAPIVKPRRQTVAARTAAIVCAGGARVGGTATIETATPFADNRAYANAWLLDELLLRDEDAA